MLQTAINIVKIPLFKYNLISRKTYLALLLGTSLNFNINPVLAQTNNNIAINQDSITQPLTIKGTSGGAIAASEIAQTEKTSTGYCDGFIQPQPNHILELDNFFEYLRLEVESDADTTIVVRGLGEIWCNDDAGSANPVIEGQWQSGVYKVWVGSYQENANYDYSIKITGQ